MKEAPNPLIGPPPDKVLLQRAPLEKVICQVRFNTILAVNDLLIVAKFQNAIRKLYPILEDDSLNFGNGIPLPFAIMQPKIERVWKFCDLDKNWRVSLHSGFIAVEASNFTNGQDLIDRLSFVLKNFYDVFSPTHVTRLGVRYINRITGEGLSEIGKLLKPSLLGIVEPAIAPRVKHFVSEARLEAEEGQIILKWGKIPKDMTFDPSITPVASEDSWVLDIDMSNENSVVFNSENISKQALIFTQRIYSIFRWMVTDKFISYYGGKNAVKN